MSAVSAAERSAMIKTFFKIKRTSFSAIAREEDLSPATIAGVARSGIKSKRIERLIADVIGLTPNELWPENYKEDET